MPRKAKEVVENAAVESVEVIDVETTDVEVQEVDVADAGFLAEEPTERSEETEIHTEEIEDDVHDEEDEEPSGTIKQAEGDIDEEEAEAEETDNKGARRAPRIRGRNNVLTLSAGERTETKQNKENTIFHELKNSQVKGRILKGTVSMTERTELGSLICVVDYKGQRVAIPMKEMALGLARPAGQSDEEYKARCEAILGQMMGAEIDFIVGGVEDTGSEKVAVASRARAMLRRRERFYFTKRANGLPVVNTGAVVEARIVSVSRRALRIEAFGVERTVNYRDISHDYISDVRDAYFVGDTVEIKINEISGDDAKSLRITADIKSLHEDDTVDKLKVMKVRTSCVGEVTDIHEGKYFITLKNGIRALAHESFDRRKPGRGDIVNFSIGVINMERKSVTGIITRIIKRNL